MKMKYCPECGSIQIQFTSDGLKCKKCNYLGVMKEDSIDVINSFIQSKKRITSDSTSILTPQNSNQTAVQSNSASTNLIMKQETKPDSLKERLKKFQNQDIEIL